MDNKEIQRWLDNADKGIAEGKPQYALASSKNLQRLGRNDLAERALRDAHDIFGDSIQVFRALATIIRERDPREGLKFAEAQAHSFGNNARFQKALALADLQRAPEAIMEIEEILMKIPKLGRLSKRDAKVSENTIPTAERMRPRMSLNVSPDLSMLAASCGLPSALSLAEK